MSESARAPKVSQQRIAKDLNLSQALVSMVLNGRREGISEESHRRIWEHALSLGYQPRRLRAGSAEKPRLIHAGVVLRSGWTLNTQSVYYNHIQHGLHEALREHGISTVFLGTEDRPNEIALRATMESRRTLRGVAILGQVAEPFLHAMKKICPKLVAVSISYPGYCHSVQGNERQALDQIVGHLAELGHRRVAWLGGNRPLVRGQERQRMFGLAMEKHGLAVEPEWMFMTDGGNRQDGRALAEQFLAKPGPRPTAIIAYNGLMARGALNFFQARGISIPAELSLAAVDATSLCTEEQPYLTGASADPEALGRKAAELLMAASGEDEEVYSDAILPSRLTVRDTTKAPASA